MNALRIGYVGGTGVRPVSKSARLTDTAAHSRAAARDSCPAFALDDTSKRGLITRPGLPTAPAASRERKRAVRD
jgi:hypothetical protein